MYNEKSASNGTGKDNDENREIISNNISTQTVIFR
jgi:hypothetical protein